jgi:sarcosine oxidase subunit beta
MTDGESRAGAGARLRGHRRSRYPARYSAVGLLRRGRRPWPPIWQSKDLRGAYDVVVIGGGVHGLATAYYLAANWGITNVAVVDKGYLGGGGSGRNTAIVRSNYLTPEGVAFYDRSVRLYERLAVDLNLNVMFSRRGHLTLAHSDGALRTMRWRAEVNKHQGVDSDVIGPAEIKRLVPALDTSGAPRYPILGALWHPPGGIIRHDAVVWGYARAAAALGVEMHQGTEVLDIDVTGGAGPEGKGSGGRITGVRTNRGDVSAPVVVNCTAGWASLISAMAGVRLPISTHPLEAAVTEPVKMFLPAVVVSGSLHVYVSQTDRGELVFGAAVDPLATYDTGGSLAFAEELAGHMLQLMPGLGRMRLLRQWSGLCDMTPDYSPIIGPTPVDGFYCDVGWGTYGFKAAPVAGEQLAACIAGDEVPALIRPFALGRFAAGRLVGEKGAAAVGH